MLLTKNILIVIVGPTAIGKTNLAIQLAQHYGCEIISCDSRQFFKEMRIGTAVPSSEELAAAQHHFIQNKSITTPYSVGDFEKEALELVAHLFLKNNIQIMVGGSGLYVDAVLKGFDEFPEISVAIRNQINTKYELLGLPFLQEQLQTLDLKYYHYLQENNPQTLQNPQRMKRFIEVCWGSGQPYSDFLNKENRTRPFTPIIIGLEAERNEMYQRINHRVDLMMQAGLLEEVSQLLPYKHLNALQTVGYRELFDFLDQNKSLAEAVEAIKTNTRRFAKRQMTWFKKSENTHWLPYQEAYQLSINYINQQITRLTTSK